MIGPTPVLVPHLLLFISSVVFKCFLCISVLLHLWGGGLFCFAPTFTLPLAKLNKIAVYYLSLSPQHQQHVVRLVFLPT